MAWPSIDAAATWERHGWRSPVAGAITRASRTRAGIARGVGDAETERVAELRLQLGDECGLAAAGGTAQDQRANGRRAGAVRARRRTPATGQRRRCRRGVDFQRRGQPRGRCDRRAGHGVKRYRRTTLNRPVSREITALKR